MNAVIGIDPSLTATGIAYPYGRLETVTKRGIRGDQRLNAIVDAIYDAVDNIASTDRDDTTAVLEDLPTHAHGAGLTGMAQGVVRYALNLSDIPYATVPPAVLKKYATGRGNATKADMRMALYKRADLDINDDNQVDAWWLRAMGLDHAGTPLVDLPATQRAQLKKVIWP